MTRRFGLWIIWSALGMLPLTGCALFERKPAIQPADPSSASTRKGPSTYEDIPPKTRPAADPPALKLELDVEQPTAQQVPPKPAENSAPQPPPPHISLAQSAPTPPPSEPLVAAMQCVFENHPNEALQHLAKYDKTTQEIFVSSLSFLSLLAQNGIDHMTAADIDVLNKHLQSLSMTLLPRTKLEIDKAYFVYAQDNGTYAKWAEGHVFSPYEHMHVHVEPRNFMSEPTNDGFVSRLAWSIQIHDRNNKVVWADKSDSAAQPEFSSSMQQGFSKTLHLYLPVTMEAGVYTLAIQLFDETQPEQKRDAVKTLEFRVKVR